jgi:hypothetical protein
MVTTHQRARRADRAHQGNLRDGRHLGAQWRALRPLLIRAMITSRNPGEHEAFGAKIIEEPRQARASYLDTVLICDPAVTAEGSMPVVVD